MNYNYSYSGADCDVYAVYEGLIKHLDSIATVSVSMYEAKAPVRRLGHASPVGFTGNIRSIAGSLIFIVKNEHPLAKVMESFKKFAKHLDDEETQKGFTNKAKRYNAGMIEPFSLMLMYKNEVDAIGAGLRINNLEFISEGIVTSVNDIVSEVVLQFVATDIDQLELERVRQPKVAEEPIEEAPKTVDTETLISFEVSIDARKIDTSKDSDIPAEEITKKFIVAIKDFKSFIFEANIDLERSDATGTFVRVSENVDISSKDKLNRLLENSSFKEVFLYYVEVKLVKPISTFEYTWKWETARITDYKVGNN